MKSRGKIHLWRVPFARENEVLHQEPLGSWRATTSIPETHSRLRTSCECLPPCPARSRCSASELQTRFGFTVALLGCRIPLRGRPSTPGPHGPLSAASLEALLPGCQSLQEPLPDSGTPALARSLWRDLFLSRPRRSGAPVDDVPRRTRTASGVSTRVVQRLESAGYCSLS